MTTSTTTRDRRSVTRVAVVGAGISGLYAAHVLSESHEISLFEAAPRLGGHTDTHHVEWEGRIHAVDSGFMVFNEATYPLLCALLRKLDIASRPTQMSFGVRCERSGLEYCGTNLSTVFAQRRNLLSPGFWRLLRGILRFNRQAHRDLAGGVPDCTVGEYLKLRRLPEELVQFYIVPMAAAIWSSTAQAILSYPAPFFLKFLQNHRLLETGDQLPWRTVLGGASRYIEPLIAPFRESVRLKSPVQRVRRQGAGVAVATSDGEEFFDRVVLAVHSDQALRMLAAPSAQEREILGAIPYQSNSTLLHTDASLLPQSRRARAHWNYLIPSDPAQSVMVNYDVSGLQGLKTRAPLIVSLNADGRVDPATVLARMDYAHPQFSTEAYAAQKRHAEINGADKIYYCGAYWGFGFHEDGLRSAMAVIDAFQRIEGRFTASRLEGVA